MKKITLLTLVMIASLAFVGCESTTENANVKVNGNTLNSNTGALVNENTNVSGMTTDKELTREEFDKDKAKYEKEAKDESATIGTGANDLWIWTKTRASFATVDDLRDSTINVDVDNAVVTLKGTVGSQAQKDAAIKAAKAIEDVKDVKADALKVDAKDSLTNQATSSDKDDKAGNTNAAKSDK